MILQPGDRPVPNSPDYVLVRKLGAGAFGEVWHAQGPGGVDVALKFIPLNPQIGPSELRSLKVMKAIRHPNLVSLFGAWHKDHSLILAMEKCDRSLQDRLVEAVDSGLSGIPLDELLGYMSDAASGLDHMNSQGRQHRDVKPANLLLVGSGLKVADFGLAKVLEHAVTSNSGAGTVAYMAPECFQGKVAQQSDQYSLAVTYYHLRTGRLLFKGDQAKIMYGHLTGKPDLSALPLTERAVVAQALSKKPGERWESCRAFVIGLVKPLLARDQAIQEERRRIRAVLGHAWDLVGRLWPEIVSQVREVRFIKVPKEARAVLAIRPSTGTLGVAIGAERIAPDYLWHELVHLQQFVEGRLPPICERTREQFLEIEREAFSRQGQMLYSGVFERLERLLATKQAAGSTPAVTTPAELGHPSKGQYPPEGLEPLEYTEHEWEMLTSVRPEDEHRQPVPD
jgi:serine/threonine protein kinase